MGPHTARDRRRQPLSTRNRHRFKRRRSLVHGLRKIDRCHGKARRALVHASQKHQTLRERCQPRDLLVNALRPLALAALNFLHLVSGINHGQRRLDFVACIGNKALLLAVALDHRSNHRARGTRHNCQHRQPANATDGHACAQKRMKACKLARAVHEHIGGLVALNRNRIAVVTRKARGQTLGIQSCSDAGGTLGAHRGNASRVDIGHLPAGNRHRKVARVEGRLRRHAFKMPIANGCPVTGSNLAGNRILTGIGLRLIRPINAVLACQDIVQASIGHFTDMRVVDDVDAGDNERKHDGHGTHGNQDELATQAAAQCASSIGTPRITRVHAPAELRRHALPPRARAHAYSPSSTTSSE